MRMGRTTVCAGAGVVLAAALTGCSMDALVWGPDGARVIETTDRLVSDMSGGTSTDLLCHDSAADLGAPSDWNGLSAGEPERFRAEYWGRQAPLDPQWNINLEGLPPGASPGSTFPGDVFYRETDDGLCVIDVAWSTLLDQD